MSFLPTHILAADHRFQLVDEAATHGRGVDSCQAFKVLVVRGFLEARESSPVVQRGGAMILDRELGAEALAEARRHGVQAGQPAEVSGAFPLKLDPQLEEAYFPSRPSFAKCLVKGRPDDEPGRRAGQHAELQRLAKACAKHGVPFLLELIVPKAQAEDEAAFENGGRAELTARWMAMLHAEGIVPAVWKLEGFHRAECAARVAAEARPGQPIVVLGKSAPPETLSKWFRAARKQPAFTGFAVGRSIFWDPFVAHLKGAPAAEVVRTVKERYLEVVRRWEEAA